MFLETYALGLTGYPLEHSLSPCMHNAALRALGLGGEYRLFPVLPLPEGAHQLARLLERVRQGELDGLNVTIPHKQAVLSMLDELSTEARAIGAVNTVLVDNHKLVGLNTDAEGFLTDLQRFFPSEKLFADFDQRALVLGAGGSARAVVYALASAGWLVCVAARRVEQAQALCESLRLHLGNRPQLKPMPFVPSAALIEPAPALIVNTTPVGMYPQMGISPWPEGLPYPPGAALYDLVYNPVETTLIRTARFAGLRVTNGFGMLLEQAALSFEHWTGKQAPRDLMKRAALLKEDPN